MLFGQLRANAKPETCLSSPTGALARMVNSSGRVGLNLLQQMVQAMPAEDFIRFVHRPVLAGSGIHLGKLASQSNRGSREMNRTILFEPVEDGEDAVSSSESLKLAIYPLTKGECAAFTNGFFSIGRTDGNDFIMPDYAISRKHALIEIRRPGYFLKDLGSTNGTIVNGTQLQNKAVEICDRDTISFARYEFIFLFPASLHDTLTQA